MDIDFLKQVVDYGIIGLLIVMSFVSVWIWIERILFYKSVQITSFKSKQELEIALTNHTSILYSFGSNAPYIGLLGTVIGIIITFYTMGESGNIEAKAIMSSLALALKATAMGLVVAIPAVFFYNHLARKMEVLIAKWEIQNQ